jgi:hypothetical protein
VRQSPAGKDVIMEAKDIVGIRNQATTGEDFMCAVLTSETLLLVTSVSVQ